MRFLIDECLPGDLASDLVTAGHDVLDVAGSPHRGVADAVIQRVAIAEQRIVIARDLDFPLPKALGRPPGLVVMRPRWNARAGQIRHLFAEFLGRVDLASLEGAVTTVEPGRLRQRRYDDLPWQRPQDAVTRDHPELTEVDFTRAIPGAVRRRLCRGEVRSGRDVAALRHFVGMIQEEFARAMGISIDTVQNWEQGLRRPRGAALALIRIVARDPRVLRRLLASSTGTRCKP